MIHVKRDKTHRTLSTFSKCGRSEFYLMQESRDFYHGTRESSNRVRGNMRSVNASPSHIRSHVYAV